MEVFQKSDNDLPEHTVP